MHPYLNRNNTRLRNLISGTLIAAASLALTGCSGPMNDTGGKYIHGQRLLAVREGRLSKMPTDLTSHATPAYLFYLKAAKDYEYGNYVRALRRATSWGEFASDSVKIILDSLVSVTGGEATKSALGAASVGVTGATTSIKKNVLFDQSITTFITKMDALRLAKWNDILCKLGRCEGIPALTSYTVAEAFTDLEEYGRCGSLDAALRGIDAKSNEEKKKAEDDHDKINKVDQSKNASGN